MYAKFFNQIINSKGLDKRDIEFTVRKEKVLTDEMIFVLSHFLNDTRTKVFFTRIIGNITISLKMFEDIAVVYVFKNKEGKEICLVDVDFYKKSLFVKMGNDKYEIGLNLLDYPNKSKLNDLRMLYLNEMMVRYYSSVIYNMYLELSRK